jgi:peptide/nickel transport system substrate-binding protein
MVNVHVNVSKMEDIGRSYMKKIAFPLFIAVIALLFVATAGMTLAQSDHWAKVYVDKLVTQKIIAEKDIRLWDVDATMEEVKTALDAALGKDTGIDVTKQLLRADIIKAAVDASNWASELDANKGDAWCMSNDELTIPADFVPYFNMGYRPKYDFLTYKKGRFTGWNKPMTYAELAYLAYKLKYPPNTKSDQQLTIVTTAEPDTINPYTTSAMSATYINTFTSWGGDVSFGDDATLFPFQLVQVPSIENGDVKLYTDPITGRNKETVTYRIRKGMFNPPMYDGESPGMHEITADDYLFSMKLSVVPRIQAISKSGMWKIESIKKVDRYTIEINWNEVYSYATWGWGDTYKAVFEQDLYTAPQDFNTREDFINFSNGPYKLTKWDKGDHIEFTPNPFAIYSQPLMSKINVRFMSDQNTIVLNLQSGNVDCAGITPVNYKDLKSKLPAYKFIFTEATSWSHIDLNLFKKDEKNPNTPALNWAFGDKRVRQALLYAIDREAINKTANEGIYKIADSWMPPKSKFYNPASIKKYPFDPKMSEKLLEGAGWKLVDIDGEKIRCLNGDKTKQFNFKFRTNSENPQAIQIAEMVKNMLGRVGLKISPTPVPGKELLGQSLVRHEWEMITFAWISNPIRPSAELFMKKNIPSPDNMWSGQNLVGWEFTDEHEKICQEMSMELPDAKLQELFDKELKIWTEELPILPMFNTVQINVCPIDLMNYKPTGSNRATSWNSAWWYKEVISE